MASDPPLPDIAGLDTAALDRLINDTHAHAIGDIVLKRLAEAVDANLPTTHLFGRLGGEELTLQALGLDPTAAAELAAHLCAGVGASRFPEAGPGLRMTVSTGPAMLDASVADLDDLRRHADDQLFEAKRDASNRVRHVGRRAR